MSLTLKQIRNLQALLKGETLAWSTISNELLQLLVDEQLVIIKTHRSHKTIYAQNVNNLQLFLEQHFEELRGFDWSNDNIPIPSSRAELSTFSGNSKVTMLRSCPGFMVNCYDSILSKIGGQEYEILPVPGTMLFIADWRHFTIGENVLVVGVENMENFRCIRDLQYLFPTSQPILFVSRYPQSTDLRNWLQSIKNQYIHFGDFDIAGLHIFETEYYKHIGPRASFFIPNDIEFRIQKGSATRYNEQISKFKNYFPLDPRVHSLFNLINKYHRCYDQEGYIKNEVP